MAISGDTYDLTNFANAFHRVFVHDKDVDLFFFESPLLSRIKVTDGFVGTDEEKVRATSFAGGYGFAADNASIPRSNESNLIRPRLTAKKYYAQATVDAESMAAAMESRGAFFELVRRVKLDLRRSIDNGLSLALTKTNIDSELVLGTIASGGVAGSAGSGWTLTLSSPHMNNFHNKQIITIEDANTDLFEITSVDRANNQVVVSRLSGTQTPAAGDELMLQGSDGNAFMGLPGALAQSGTLYNVTIGSANNWIGRTSDKSDAAVNEHMLYNEVLQIKNICGKSPNLIVCGLTQYLKVKEFLSNKRVLNDLSDAMGHKAGCALESDEGPIPVIWDRHVENDKIYFLNTDKIELRKRPLEGMVSHAGEMLLPMHVTGSDQYLLIYRCYGNFYIEPTYHSELTNLNESLD